MDESKEETDFLKLHENVTFAEEVVNLLSSEWPRSKAARYHSLNLSNDNFPCAMVLVRRDPQCHSTEVVGHCVFSKVHGSEDALFIENVIVPKSKRGCGYGRLLMQRSESFAQKYVTQFAALRKHLGEKNTKTDNSIKKATLKDLPNTPSQTLATTPTAPMVTTPAPPPPPPPPLIPSDTSAEASDDKKAANSIKSELDKFADWILSYVPEPIKKTAKEAADKRVKRLKERIKRLHEEVEDRFTPKEQQTALKGYLKTHGIAGQRGYDPKTFIVRIKPKVLELISQQKKPIKVKFIFTCGFIKEDPATAQIEEELGYFHTEKPEIVTESTDLSDLFDTMTNYLLGLVELFQKQGSGWQFDQVEYFDINIDPFEPLSGSSYIPLPPKLASKKAIINVKNENDHECFKWAYNNMCGGVVRRKQNGRFSESDKELWSLLSICLAKQKAMKRKRTPDFYKVAVLEKSIRRLNDEIADRCLRKTKRRRKSAAYEWNSGGHGWNTTASFQDDEDLLGIDDFFRELSKCNPKNCNSTDYKESYNSCERTETNYEETTRRKENDVSIMSRKRERTPDAFDGITRDKEAQANVRYLC
ncbi:predicted protein [Nematostella vectensis]|uniref:N-acetyltransferase domain-containing protein n=1 Tax=Nematostella vectensis TaxID=45351 RepID=A7RWT8_NEMVE|nr:predicted protein [Nematostella vectensis]|eukprot:XP_001636094.1 predicted protein [Nematostella vectensis]